MFNPFNHKTPEKPKTQKAQIDSLWDAMHNHLWHRVDFLNWQVGFLVLLVIALLTVVLIK